MRKFLGLLILLGCVACSTPRHAPRQDAVADPAMNELVFYAMSLAETDYRYGGNTPDTGFDCSGFVRHVFRQSLGLTLPRTSLEISRTGYALDSQPLRPGDLVFYNTSRQDYSHVGIYVGDRRFVHAPRVGSRVRVENMDLPYWQNRYNGARRVNPG